MAIANLKARLGLDSKDFRAGVKGAKGSTQSFGQSIAKVGAMVGVAFSAQAVISMGKAFVSWASDISIAARNLGILTSELMAMNRIAVQNGSDFGQVQKMMARVEADTFGAITGTRELVLMYDELGLTMERLYAPGMDPVKRLQMVGEAALNSANPTGALAGLFGTKLGPQSRLALEGIVAGLDDVDVAAGGAADRIEALGSKYDLLKEKSKSSILSMLADFVALSGKTPKWLTSLMSLNPKTSLAGSLLSTGKMIDEQTTPGQTIEDKKAALKTQNEETADLASKAQAKLDAARYQKDRVANAKWFEDRDAAQKKLADSALALEDKRLVKLEEYWKRMNAPPDLTAYKAFDAALRNAEQNRENIKLGARGEGVQASGLARIGGVTGGELPGLAVADKQLRVMTDMLALQKREAEEAARDRASKALTKGSWGI